MAKSNSSPEGVVREIKRKARRVFNAEEKIRIVLEGLRGEEGTSALCRREGIHTSQRKEFLEAGKNGLTKETLRDATSDQVKRLKAENSDLKKAVAELTLDVIKYKKTLGM